MRILTVVTAAAVSLSATTALAAEGVGEAMAVIDAASASGQVGKRTLAEGARVFIGDFVATDPSGEAQLQFDDQTRIVVGRHSSLFLSSSGANEKKVTFSEPEGTFRFLSSELGFCIKTPSAEICSSEAAAVDVAVTSSGGTKLVLLEGEVTFCSKDGECATVATRCEMFQTDIGQYVKEIKARNEWVQETLDYFPYLISQSGLREEFQTDAGCLLGGSVGTIAEVAARRRQGEGGTTDGGSTDGGSTDGGTTDGGTTDGGTTDGGTTDGGTTDGNGNNGPGNGGEASQGEPDSGATGQDGRAEGDRSNPGRGGGRGGRGGNGRR